MQALDRALSALESGAMGAAREVEACLTEVETNLSYLNDILSTGALPPLAKKPSCLYATFFACRLLSITPCQLVSGP